MQLTVGDRVMHPIHGVGRVIEVKHQELVAGFEHYYVIEVPAKRLTVHIPMSKIDKMGVRPIMPQAELNQVVDMLRRAPSPLPTDVIKRVRQLREKIETSQPIRVAEAVRDLSWLEKSADITSAETELLDRAQELLAAEMALLTGTEVSDANKRLNTILEEAYNRPQAA